MRVEQDRSPSGRSRPLRRCFDSEPSNIYFLTEVRLPAAVTTWWLRGRLKWARGSRPVRNVLESPGGRKPSGGEAPDSRKISIRTRGPCLGMGFSAGGLDVNWRGP